MKIWKIVGEDVYHNDGLVNEERQKLKKLWWWFNEKCVYKKNSMATEAKQSFWNEY